MSDPEVSIIIPTRDRWSLVQRALHAALAQTGVSTEVIVVVDGGRDETARELAAWPAGLVRLVELDPSHGVAVARNRGAAVARGSWLSFLDDDDVWAPERTAGMLRAAGDAGLVVGGRVNVDAEGRVLDFNLPRSAEAILTVLDEENCIGGPSAVLVRRSAFEAVGGFDPAFAVLADWELWLRLASRFGIAVDPVPANGYVVHLDGMHVHHFVAAEDEFRRMADLHRDGRRAFDDEQFLRWIASTHKRAGRRGPAVRGYLRSFGRSRRAIDLRGAAGAVLGPRLSARVRGRSDLTQGRDRPGWLDGFFPGA